MTKISNNEIYQFDQKGFLIKKNFFTKSFIKKILNEIDLIKFKDGSKKFDRYFGKSLKDKNRSILVRIENFYKKSKYLTKVIDNKSIKKILSKLFRNKATLFKEKINFKPPGCGPDRLHQDLKLGGINMLKII